MAYNLGAAWPYREWVQIGLKPLEVRLSLMLRLSQRRFNALLQIDSIPMTMNVHIKHARLIEKKKMIVKRCHVKSRI